MISSIKGVYYKDEFGFVKETNQMNYVILHILNPTLVAMKTSVGIDPRGGRHFRRALSMETYRVYVQI